jgi:hypothetical protein
VCRDFVVAYRRCDDASGSSVGLRDPCVDACSVDTRTSHTFCTMNLLDTRMSAVPVEPSDGIFGQWRHAGRLSDGFGRRSLRLNSHVEQPLQSAREKLGVFFMFGKSSSILL